MTKKEVKKVLTLLIDNIDTLPYSYESSWYAREGEPAFLISDAQVVEWLHGLKKNDWFLEQVGVK